MDNSTEEIPPQDIINKMRDSIVIVGKNGKFKYISPQFAELLGGIEAEIGDDIFNIIHPNLVASWKKKFQEAIDQKKFYDGKRIETRLVHKEKNEIPVECLASNYFDKNDNWFGYIVSVRDITERKKMEKKLTKEKEKYRLLTEKQKDVTMAISLEGKLLYCSPAVRGFGGYEPDQEIGEPIEKYIASKSDASMALDLIKESIKDREQKEIEIFYQPATGKPFPIEVTTTPVIEDGQIKKFHCIMRDISRRKEVEEELKESKRELKELNKKLEQKVQERTKKLRLSKKKLEQKNIRLKKLDTIKNNFISMAAHELKTPLASIYGYIDYILLANKEKLDKTIIEDLKIALRNVNRLKKYINQLLDVMKIEESKIRLQKAQTNFKRVLDACIDELQILINQKDHDINLDIEEDLWLHIDSERIFQVCANLLSNSIKFTPEGGKISISAKKKDKEFVFKISNNGQGLSESKKRFLFNKFEKLGLNIDNYPKGKGSGLGLFISKGIIEAHGGNLWAESKGEGKGSTFIFKIPLNNS